MRILLLLALLWLLVTQEVSRQELLEQNTRYAAVIAAAANSGEFAIGEGWLVSCKGRKVVVY